MKIKIENPGEIELVKSAIEKLLDTGLVEITFVKNDGQVRVMKCTASPAIIFNSETAESISTETVKRVFDVEKQAWRSFKWSTVKKVKLG